MKLGKTSVNPQNRYRVYQGSDPYRAYKYEWFIEVQGMKAKDAERLLLKKLQSRRLPQSEWLVMSVEELRAEASAFGPVVAPKF